MKNIYLLFALGILIMACDRIESLRPDGTEIIRRELTQEEQVLKDNLQLTAKIIAGFANDKEVNRELDFITSESRTQSSVLFKELLAVTEKGSEDCFKNLREKFLHACAGKGTSDGLSLSEYLIRNNCCLYCPYPDDFYSNGEKSYTVSSHPIDNDYEGIGYIVDFNDKLTEIFVNEEYADENQVLLIMPYNNEQELASTNKTESFIAKGDTVYEVKIGYIRCADYCGGIFEGELELRVGRGYPSFNSETEILTGSFSTVIPITYPRSYAKAAINNWSTHSNGGWYPVNVVWDSNWRIVKAQQCILAYEYDHSTTKSVSGDVGYKNDTLSTEIKATATTTYRGYFLGIAEWDRNWFFSTYSNPGPTDEEKYGLTVRKTSTVLKMTTPLRRVY